MAQCPKCGGDVVDGSKFCPSCGAPQDNPQNTPAAPINQPAIAPGQMPPMPQNQAPTQMPQMPPAQGQMPPTPQYPQQPYQPQYPQQQYTQQQQYAPVPNPQDNGGIGWGALGCCIPLAGLILFLVWKDNKPKTAKAAGIGALIGFALTALMYIFSFTVGMSSGGGYYF